MDEPIIFPLTFEGKEYEFPGRIKRWGYTYRIEINIRDAVIYYEKDEEGKWRAIMGYEDLLVNKQVPVKLVQALADLINEVTSAGN